MPSAPTDRGPAEELIRHDMADTMLKQLGRATIKGQKITVYLREPDKSVSGYLAGIDGIYWFILQPDSDPKQGKQVLRQHLVRQDGGSHLEIHAERTYDEEPLKNEMDVLIVRFRTWITRNVFERK